MKIDDRDHTIEDIHRVRDEIAVQFGGDLFSINADARARMEQSGRVVRRRRNPPNQMMHGSGGGTSSENGGSTFAAP